MSKYKSFKIDISPEDQKFLEDRRWNEGILLTYQLSEAVKLYINTIKAKQNENK